MLIAALIFLVVVIASVTTVLLYISGMSAKNNGWARLAEAYGSTGTFPERRLSFVTTTLNSYVLQHLMVLGLSEAGLGLRPILLFRAFHPALLIPWGKLRTTRQETAFGVSYRVDLGLADNRIEWSDATHQQVLKQIPEDWQAARAALNLVKDS